MAVELHCHTLFSVDGHGTPETLVDIAAEQGVTTLSITEHNHLGSLKRACRRSTEQGIRYLTGVELDAVWQGEALHLLAFGFEPDHPDLQALAEENHALYERRFELYLKILAELGYPVSGEDLSQGLARRYPTHPAPVMNQWFAETTLVHQGVFPDRATFRQALAEAKSHLFAGPGPQALGQFAPFREVITTVHRAGGVGLLAHVAKYFPGEAERQIALIQALTSAGLDGFELYHPANLAEPHFDRLALEAQISGCLISGGSDCHDASASGPGGIGSAPAPETIVPHLESAVAHRRRSSSPPRFLDRFRRRKNS